MGKCKTHQKIKKNRTKSCFRFLLNSLQSSPISHRTFKGLDKLTNGVTDNQGVKLPKN